MPCSKTSERCLARKKNYDRKWREKNRDKSAASSRRLRKNNPGLSAAYTEGWRERHPKRYLVSRARIRAKEAGIPFDLSEDDFELPERCPILGIRFERGTRGGPIGSSPSLDRIVPAQGYVRGNVVVVSHRANRLKSDATMCELRRIADFYQPTCGETDERGL